MLSELLDSGLEGLPVLITVSLDDIGHHGLLGELIAELLELEKRVRRREGIDGVPQAHLSSTGTSGLDHLRNRT